MEKGSLEAYRILTGWKQPPLPPLPEKPKEQLSRPMRVGEWHKLFLLAKYSDNLSMTSFRKFLKEQITAGHAKRETKRGPVQFDRDYLTEIGVELDEK